MKMKPGILVLTAILFSNAIMAQVKILKTWYPSGKLQSVKHEDNFNGCNMPVGTDSTFSTSGVLYSTTTYKNFVGKKEVGCHGSWTTETRRTFHPTGKLKNQSMVKYAYEGTACECGTWLNYTINGKLISKKYYSNCSDQLPCSE